MLTLLNRQRLRPLLTTVILLLPFMSEVFAAGTPAGTVIQSRSRVIYTTRSGVPADTAYSSFVTIVVAAKASISITPATSASTTASDSTVVDYPATIVNGGNAVDGVTLRTVSTRGFSHSVYRDGNGDGILQTGERSLGPISSVTSIPMDGQIPLIVRISIPRDASLNGITDSSRLIARSQFDTAVTNEALYATLIRSAVLNAAAPGLSVDPASAVAGQQVTYSFTLTNSGSVSAAGVVITNVLPSGTTVISGTASAGTFSGSGNPVNWTVGTLAPGQSVTVTLILQINTNISAGTIISTSFGLRYSVGSNVYSGTTNTATVIVTGTPQFGVDVAAVSSSQTRSALDTAIYRFTVRNTGAFSDVIEFSAMSDAVGEWALYRDANNNSLWDAQDLLFLNSNDSAGVDSDSLKSGDSLRVFARAVIPLREQDLFADTLKLIAASAGDQTKSSMSTTVTMIQSPMVSLTKTMFPAGNQPAGSVITYKINYANTGSVAVSQFSVIDTAPAQTRYIPNSVKVNDVAVADNSGSVSITSDAGNNTVIAVSIGTLAAQSAGSVEFRVKIK